MTEQQYEYAVMHERFPEEPHRGPFATREPADHWVGSALEDGFRPHVFYVVRRPVGVWERLPAGVEG